MASIQSLNQLCENVPDIVLVGIFLFVFQPLDLLAQVSASTILHINVQLLSGFEVLAVAVTNNIGMVERMEDYKFGLELLPLFDGHFEVLDFLATKDLEMR